MYKKTIAILFPFYCDANLMYKSNLGRGWASAQVCPPPSPPLDQAQLSSPKLNNNSVPQLPPFSAPSIQYSFYKLF